MTNPILLDTSFFDEINKYRENTNRTKLKLNSMKQYINNYNIVSKMVDAKDDDEVHFLSNPDIVFEAMKRDNWKTKKPPSNSTTRNYLNSLIIVGNELPATLSTTTSTDSSPNSSSKSAALSSNVSMPRPDIL